MTQMHLERAAIQLGQHSDGQGLLPVSDAHQPMQTYQLASRMMLIPAEIWLRHGGHISMSDRCCMAN